MLALFKRSFRLTLSQLPVPHAMTGRAKGLQLWLVVVCVMRFGMRCVQEHAIHCACPVRNALCLVGDSAFFTVPVCAFLTSDCQLPPVAGVAIWLIHASSCGGSTAGDRIPVRYLPRVGKCSVLGFANVRTECLLVSPLYDCS